MMDAETKVEFWEMIANAIKCDKCPVKKDCKNTTITDDDDRCSTYLKKRYEELEDD